MRRAECLFVAGYSFPPTDEHAYSLLDDFLAGPGKKRIEIIDPFPDGVEGRVRARTDGRCDVAVHQGTLATFLGADQVHLEGDEPPAPPRVFRDLIGGDNEENARRQHVIAVLGHCNLHRNKFDLTTHDGRRFLDASLEGEFVTHLYGAYHPEVFEYRVNTIPITTDDNQIVILSISDIWIVHPLRQEKITQKELDAADPTSLGPEIREMIRFGYHCKDDAEADYFFRRYLAS